MGERIRVVQLVYTFHIESGGGGITRAAIGLAQHLDPKVFEVSVIALGHTGNLAEDQWLFKVNAQGIRASAAVNWDERQPFRSFAKAYKSLSTQFRLQPIDIIHSHSEFSDIMGVLLKIQKRAPVVIRTTHYGHPNEWRNKPLRRALFTNLLYPILFNLEAGVNPYIRDRLNRRFVARLLHRKAILVNEAVGLERFQETKVNVPDKKSSLGITPNAKLVGCVGRLVEQKGHTYLLSAAKKVLAAQPGLYFLIIGDGPLDAELKNYARKLGIEKQIVFTGPRTDIEELLPCMDLFALASLWEGMPISVLESMASGVPVVTTEVPGSRDLIRHGENGWLVPPADAGALSQAILALIAEPAKREYLAQNALQTVQEYSVRSMANQYANLYRILMKKT